MHVFTGPYIADKGDYTPVAPTLYLKSGFLLHFTQHAFIGAFVSLTLATHTYPFVVTGIVLLLNTMKHQVLSVALQIAQSGLFHG